MNDLKFTTAGDYMDVMAMSSLIRPLVDEKDPFLREKPEFYNFDSPYEDPDKLEDRLLKNIQRYNGIGLSANQLGIPVKAFAMITDGEPIVVFNPEIVEWSEEETYEKEGCLSFPHLFMSIKRSETIGTKFQLKDGTEHFGSFGGLLARIFQHEMDHMEGDLYIDMVSDFKLRSAMKKRKILKRKAERKKRNG